jgi:hypothetical protein
MQLPVQMKDDRKIKEQVLNVLLGLNFQVPKKID